MALLNLSMLLGSLFVAVPVVLHLIMRQQPKQMVFPAVRFLQQRREANRRRLQLRHWLLLALRCLALLLLALALARPAVAADMVGHWVAAGALLLATLAAAFAALYFWQSRGRWQAATLGAAGAALLLALIVLVARTLATTGHVPLADQEAAVAAVLVVDTAPRMQYRHANKTRLEEAQDTARWLLSQLPAESEVAVGDTRPGPLVFSVDVAAAAAAIERLRISGATRPLPELIEQAVTLAADHAAARKEVYVLTDRTQAAWQTDQVERLRSRLEADEEVALYIIDVGVEEPQDVAVSDLQLSGEVLTESSPLEVQVQVRRIGPPVTAQVELYIEEPDPTLPIVRDGKPQFPVARRRSQQTVQLQEDGSQWVRFQLRGIERGVQQGFVRVVGEDGLPLDDERYFAVQVQDRWPVLVAAGEGANATFFTEAIAPYNFRTTGQARFDCQVVDAANIGRFEADDYRAVCLLDPGTLGEQQWKKLTAYVRGGGSLAIFLGHNAEPAAFNGEAAQQVLGGQLVRQWRAGANIWFLAPRDLSHPMLAVFREMPDSVPWQRFPVDRHWELEPLAAGTRVVLRYSNGEPAVLDRAVGKGRVLTMTTPVSDPARPAGRRAWNELPTAENAWPYVVLMNEMMLYLASSGDERLNYLAGETAELVNDRRQHPLRYQLFLPQGDPTDLVARDDRVTVRFTDAPGAYRLKGDRDGVMTRGFAVNLTAAATDVTPMPLERLDDVLGENRYQYARDREQIVRVQGRQRVGREFYPLLIVLAALALALEYLLANRFYRQAASQERAAPSVPPPAAAEAVASGGGGR